MKGENTATPAERLLGKLSPEEIADRNEKAKRDRDAYRRQVERQRAAKRS